MVNADLKALNIPLNSWYNLTLDRNEWFQQLCTREVMDSHHPGVRCTVEDLECGCGYGLNHRQGDLTRHLKFCTVSLK